MLNRINQNDRDNSPPRFGDRNGGAQSRLNTSTINYDEPLNRANINEDYLEKQIKHY